jgi:hypothetical protein
VTRAPLSPFAVERELRARLTKTEYVVLQSRLTGAVKAIATLRERAPDLVPLMFGDRLERAKTLPPHTQSALATLIEGLLAAAATTPTGRVDQRRILKLVARAVEKCR